MVVELNPVGDCTAGMLQRFEAMSVHALLLERADHAFDHPVLLWAVRRDELLTQAITPYPGRVIAAREDQTVVAAKQEWCRNPAEAEVAYYENIAGSATVA